MHRYLWLLVPLVANCGKPINPAKEPKVPVASADGLTIIRKHCEGPRRKDFMRFSPWPPDSVITIDSLREAIYFLHGERMVVCKH